MSVTTKEKVLTIGIISDNDFQKKALHDAENIDSGIFIDDPYSVYFKNEEELLHSISYKKLKMLNVIKHQAPGSIYELAKIMKKDFKTVYCEIVHLYKLGLVKIEKTDKGRKSLKPSVIYDKILIEV